MPVNLGGQKRCVEIGGDRNNGYLERFPIGRREHADLVRVAIRRLAFRLSLYRCLLAVVNPRSEAQVLHDPAGHLAEQLSAVFIAEIELQGGHPVRAVRPRFVHDADLRLGTCLPGNHGLVIVAGEVGIEDGCARVQAVEARPAHVEREHVRIAGVGVFPRNLRARVPDDVNRAVLLVGRAGDRLCIGRGEKLKRLICFHGLNLFSTSDKFGKANPTTAKRAFPRTTPQCLLHPHSKRRGPSSRA